MKIDLLERRETDPAVIPKAALAQGELLGMKSWRSISSRCPLWCCRAV